MKKSDLKQIYNAISTEYIKYHKQLEDPEILNLMCDFLQDIVKQLMSQVTE